MATIPEPDWLSLDETAILVRECTGAEGSRIETALIRAFRNGNITTRGRCHFYFGHYMQLELDGHCWDRAEVDWQTSQFKQGASVFLDVEICRKDILLWLGDEEDPPDAIDGVTESPIDGKQTGRQLRADQLLDRERHAFSVIGPCGVDHDGKTEDEYGNRREQTMAAERAKVKRATGQCGPNANQPISVWRTDMLSVAAKG